MSKEQAKPITAEVLSTPGSVSQEVRNNKFDKLTELSETARLTESEVITYKIDLLCICAEQRDGWKQEKSKDFWKVTGLFAEDIKAIAKASGVSESNLQVQSKISHPWFSNLLPVWENETYSSSKMYQPIIERYSKLHTFAKRAGNMLDNQRKDNKGNVMKLFKSFDIDVKSVDDLNILQIQEQVFRSAVKSMKEYVDARNGGNGKEVSIEMFNGMLALPDVDGNLDTTKTCREYTKNLETFDFKDASIDYDNMIISQQPVAPDKDDIADDTAPVLSESDKAFKLMKDRVHADNPNETISDVNVIARYSELVSLDSTIDSVNIDAIDDSQIDTALERLESQVKILTDGLAACKDAIKTLTNRKVEIETQTAKQSAEKLSDVEFLAMAKARGLVK